MRIGEAKRTRWGMAALLAGLAIHACAADGAADGPLVNADTRLAIIGDSITEQKIYSRFMELYLVACAPVRPAAVFQFGWGGETAPGFARRMEFDCLTTFKPTLMTTAFGMNDGRYTAYRDDIGKPYRAGMADIARMGREAGVFGVIGGPGAVDSRKFRNDPAQAATYNENLGQLSNLAREVAEENGFRFVDVHRACMDAMAKFKAELGDDIAVMGGDGVHPNENGQLAMAYAFLKGLGFDGDIGHITFDLAAQGDARVTVRGEHRAVVAGDGAVTLTSARWPFCFTGAAKGESSLAMAPYLPFNADLNRFVLVVKNLDEPFAEVRWGTTTKRFTREALAAGVNLAEAFAGVTPFQAAWGRLNGAVAKKQNMETWMIKNLRAQMRASDIFRDDAELKAAAQTFWDALYARAWPALAAAVTEAAGPVEHTIAIRAHSGQPTVIKADVADVDEAADYRLAYDLDLNNLRGAAPAYGTDVALDVGPFKRAAYLLELGAGNTVDRWVWVSFDAPTDDASKLGVPVAGIHWQQALANMNVRTNADAVTAGDGLTGWIEFWPNNYAPANGAKAPDASDTTYDWGDQPNGGDAGYGSMQVHNPAEKQVIFALNNWRDRGPDAMDLGIGTNPDGHPDYTFKGGADQYATKRLRVFVK